MQHSKKMKTMNALHRIALAAGMLILLPAPARADDLETLRKNTIDLIRELSYSGTLDRHAAEALVNQVRGAPDDATAEVARPAAPPTGAAQPTVVAVARPSVMSEAERERMTRELREEIKQELKKEVLEQAKAEGWAPRAAPVGAIEANRTAANVVQALVDNGILSRERADGLVREAKRSAAQAAASEDAAAKVVRVPYVPVTVRNEIKEELRKEVMAQAKNEGWAAPNKVPEWLEGTKWEGDFRLRYQHEQFAKDNFSPLQLGFVEDPITVSNSQDADNRFRARLRFGMETRLSDMTRVGFRLATGSFNNPLSTNQTLGNNFNRWTVGVDRAYATLAPLDWLTFSGGRIANPFLSTDLVWHPDLNFDGAMVHARRSVTESTVAFVTVGAFPLNKIDKGPTTSAPSKWLYAGQLGGHWTANKMGVSAGLALYGWRNIEGRLNTGDFAIDPVAATQFDGTAPGFRQKGNSIAQIQAVNNPTVLYALASKFREVNLTASLDLAYWEPYHVVLTADYVKNIGFNRNEIRQRTGRDLAPETTGYMGRVTVGKPVINQRHDWNVFAAYKYIGRDAVVDAYTDTDFRLGGTDAKGYILGANYGIDRKTWLTFKLLSANQISGPPLGVDVLQLDLNSRF